MAKSLSDKEVEELLSTEWTLRLATQGPGDSLNLTALWFYWAGEQFYIFTRGQKMANIRRNPDCTVLLDGGDRYPELHGIMMHSTARILEDADAEKLDPFLESVVRDGMGKKYAEGEAPGAGKRNESTAFRDWRWIVIEPSRNLTWDNRKLG
jgi:nitroimidazol reductase NimA-like FMN-containing flavoprotein (pyridoxamine 5'-phosphate oxidase superfamily)